MKLNLLSCDADRPNKRTISRCFVEIANMDESLASELTDILLEGDSIEIEVDPNANAPLRALRKLSIDYEIIE